MSTGDEVDVRLCRVCNLEASNCHALYEPHLMSDEQTTLATVLSFCANMEVLEEDHFLPTHICGQCLETLTQVYIFKRTVLRTDYILRKRYTDLCRQRRATALEALSAVAASATRSPLSVAENQAGRLGLNALTEAVQRPLLDCEYYYVLTEEPPTFNAAESIVDVAETVEGVIEETPEDDYHFEGDEQNVDVIEVIDYETAKAADEEEQEQHQIQATDVVEAKSMTVKTRMPRRRKSVNPSLLCMICGKQLSTSNSYKYHMQLHSNVAPFLCNICGESFKTRNAYDGHITLHDPNNPNKCEHCGKTYRQASSLRSHLLTHTGEKPFRCDICGKGLTQKSGYKKHMLTHTGEKPHSCNICERTFRYSSNLIAHKRCHTQDKPHQCDICNKAFGSSSELNRHKLVHSNDRPFLCPACGKTFKRQVSLLMHQRMHENTFNEPKPAENEERMFLLNELPSSMEEH